MLNERRMKMKKSFLPIAFLAVFMLMATNSQAQSWSDLLNKDNNFKSSKCHHRNHRIYRHDRNMELQRFGGRVRIG